VSIRTARRETKHWQCDVPYIWRAYFFLVYRVRVRDL